MSWKTSAIASKSTIRKSIFPVSTRFVAYDNSTEEVTVMVADIRGFTSIAEYRDPQDCIRILNAFFAVAVDAVEEFDGAVDKFQGDSVMALFSSNPKADPHERRAVHAAIRLRTVLKNLVIPELPVPLRIGIGISSGVAALGFVGADRRKDFTAIGDVVNVTHRLQAISEPNQIVISAQTQKNIGSDVRVDELGEIELKGRLEPVTAFAVK
jgi:adenylate cyclase